jgi:hypothetical protein
MRIHNFFPIEQIKSELQDILARMMREDVSSLELLRNNAKTIGGIVGAEYDFFDQKMYEGEYFIDKNLLEYQDLQFSQIEKSSLGKQIKAQVSKLEGRARGLQGAIA